MTLGRLSESDNGCHSGSLRGLEFGVIHLFDAPTSAATWGVFKRERERTSSTHRRHTVLFTDVTNSGVIIRRFVVHGHYHTFWELKHFKNVFNILFKCVYKYLCNIVIVKFLNKSNRFLRIECIVKALYVVTKSAGGVFLIPFGVALVRVWLTC